MSGSKSRRKGHNYERDLKNKFRKLGWEDCNTSRYESRKKDDDCVDLCNTYPFNIQAKHIETGVNGHKELSKMPGDECYNVVFHKRNYKGGVVMMREEDFFELVEILKNEEII